ncbi:MAG: flagellar biosynthesis anti-sigma factor FlgM [Gammaproteobacteria bacterium]
MDIKDVNNLANLGHGHVDKGGRTNGATPGARGTNHGTQQGAATNSDTVHLTAAAEHLQQLHAALASVPIVDAQRVGAVRQTIANGTFVPDPPRIADRLIRLDAQLPAPGRP